MFLAGCRTTRLVGVCDLSAAAARFTAGRWSADMWTTDLAEMLASARPDVVHVLTPAHTHHDISIRCLRAGAHVIVEKPIELHASSLEELIAEGQRCGRYVTEDHNYLFDPGVQRIARLVNDGRLGEVRDVSVHIALQVRNVAAFNDPVLVNPVHCMPAGVIHEVLTHLAYLALQFVPGPFETVAAAWRNHGETDIFRFDDLDAIAIAGDRHVRIRFSAATWPERFTISVEGSRGRAEAEIFQPYVRVELQRSVGLKLSSTVNQVANGFGLARAGLQNFGNKLVRLRTTYAGLQNYLERTYEAIAAGTKLPVDVESMLATSHFVDSLLADAHRI
jgi:predicted dehydrogenase